MQPQRAKYRWVITDDFIPECGGISRVGVTGPRGADESIVDNPAKWEAFDDDGNIYYAGKIFGDYDGFEPLDDFCMPDAGCTAIKLNGKWL